MTLCLYLNNMQLDLYIEQDGQRLRCGYTTGSCATAAAKAAAIILKNNSALSLKNYDGSYSVKIGTPAGYILDLPIENFSLNTLPDGKKFAVASVQKDAGDDPDTTDHILIYAKVFENCNGDISIDGGEGIGRITKKGLFGEVGEAAINPVPRKTIRQEVLSILPQGADVIIFCPEGAEVGKRTFNKNIGVVGGISIIGTKGIVYPMSEDALKKTIYMELNAIAKNCGTDSLLLIPGNYGEKIATELNIKLPTVQTSNYIGDSLTYAYSKGFHNITLLGHIGKFAKLAIGIFNTHNRTADTRMESFIYYLAMMGINKEILEQVNSFLTAEECFNFLVEQNLQDVIQRMEQGAELRIKKYLKDDTVNIKVIIYSMKYGIKKR